MKKLFLTFILLISIFCSVNAQTYRYRSTEFAIKTHSSYGWSDWSDWQDSNVLITINFDNDIITIYSPVTQKIKAIDGPQQYTDNKGGSNAKFLCYDLVDDCYCELRLRVDKNNTTQIYLDYSNVMYVYNVRLIE